MDRLERQSQGFTLLELIIAVALSAVVFLSASNLLINFGKFTVDVVKNEASLMGTALGAYEEIVAKMTVANRVTIPATNFAAPSIDIRVSPTGAATSSHANDIFYTYWKNGGELRYKTSIGAPPVAGGGAVIAKDISTFSFVADATNKNNVAVTLEAQPTNGPKEHLETKVSMRSRSANFT